MVPAAEGLQALGLELMRIAGNSGSGEGLGLASDGCGGLSGVPGPIPQSGEMPSSHLTFNVGLRPSPTNFSGTQIVVFPLLQRRGSITVFQFRWHLWKDECVRPLPRALSHSSGPISLSLRGTVRLIFCLGL